MEKILGEFAISFTAFFVALDVIGILPLFLSLTQTMPEEDKKHVVNRSMGVALILALVFTFIGRTVFHHLGISIADFKIAGGLILLLIALADLLGGPETHQRSSGSTGIVPIAVPLITGPATLTTLILQVDLNGYLITLGALIANYLLAWLVLKNAYRVAKVLGKDGTVVLSKIAALLLAAISVSMIRSGVFELIEVLRARG